MTDSSSNASLAQINSQTSRDSFLVRHHIDLPIVLGLVMALCLSLFVIYSASGQQMDMLMRHLLRTGTAFALMIIFAQIPPKYLARFSLYAYLIGLAMLVMVDLFGDVSKGAQRWLNLGMMRIQPSEIFKVVIPLIVAAFLARGPLPPRPLSTVIALALVGIPTILVLRQPDLGTAVLIAISGIIAIFLAGLSWWFIAAGVAAAAAALPVLWL